MGKQWKQWQTLFWGAPKSLQMVTAVMKLKDTCSLEEVQFSCSVVSDSFATPRTAAYQASLSITNSWNLHVHLVSDTIQPSNPLSSPSPPAFNLSQHQGLLQWVSSLHQVAKVLELQLQSFQWIFMADFLLSWVVWSPCSPRDSQESSPTPQSKSINSSVLSFIYSPTLTSIHDYWKDHSLDYILHTLAHLLLTTPYENSINFSIWWEELTHWERPWCWERLKTGGEGDSRWWDGWISSLTWWTWVWTNSGRW